MNTEKALIEMDHVLMLLGNLLAMHQEPNRPGAFKIIQGYVQGWYDQIQNDSTQEYARKCAEHTHPEIIREEMSGYTPQQKILKEMDQALGELDRVLNRTANRDISILAITLETVHKFITGWTEKINSLPLIEPELWAYMVKKLGGLQQVRMEFEALKPMTVELTIQPETAEALREYALEHHYTIDGCSRAEFIIEFLEAQIALMMVARDAVEKGEV